MTDPKSEPSEREKELRRLALILAQNGMLDTANRYAALTPAPAQPEPPKLTADQIAEIWAQGPGTEDFIFEFARVIEAATIFAMKQKD